MAIRVYHNTDGSSDKYWAISDQLDSDGNHEIWYGRRGSTLTFTTRSESKHWNQLAAEKLRKGYVERSSLTVDRQSRKVVNTTNISDLPSVSSTVERSKFAYFVVKPWKQEQDEQLDLKSEVSAMRFEFIEVWEGCFLLNHTL